MASPAAALIAVLMTAGGFRPGAPAEAEHLVLAEAAATQCGVRAVGRAPPPGAQATRGNGCRTSQGVGVEVAWSSQGLIERDGRTIRDVAELRAVGGWGRPGGGHREREGPNPEAGPWPRRRGWRTAGAGGRRGRHRARAASFPSDCDGAEAAARSPPVSWTSCAPSVLGTTTASPAASASSWRSPVREVGRDDRTWESPARLVGHHRSPSRPTIGPRSGAVEGHGRTAARRDDADAAGELAARLDREAVAGDIPGELGREGTPEAWVWRRPSRTAGGPPRAVDGRRQMPRSARVARSTRIS